MSNRLDSLVVECWSPGFNPDQRPRDTKDFNKMVPVVPLFSTQHEKGNTDPFSKNSNNTIFEGLVGVWLKMTNKHP